VFQTVFPQCLVPCVPNGNMCLFHGFQTVSSNCICSAGFQRCLHKCLVNCVSNGVFKLYLFRGFQTGVLDHTPVWNKQQSFYGHTNVVKVLTRRLSCYSKRQLRNSLGKCKRSYSATCRLSCYSRQNFRNSMAPHHPYSSTH